jgi:acylpyruvate hydrolase
VGAETKITVKLEGSRKGGIVMRLLTFRKRGERITKVGAMSAGGEVVDLNAAYASYLFEKGDPHPQQFANAYIPTDMIEFIFGGKTSLKAAGIGIAYAEEKKRTGEPLGLDSEKLLLPEKEIEYMPPILRPSKMLSAGMNYGEHLADSGRTAPEKPVAFFQSSSAFVGHHGEIVSTRTTRALDYEIELAFVIGKEGKYIKRDEAIEYVYGYTIYNDISERELQIFEMKHGLLLAGKNMDTFAPIGPWIVTRDEIEDPHNLPMTLRVNGEIRQNSNTKHMIYSIFDQIAYWSGLMTLYPGDIFGTGTPSGVAMGRKPSPEPYYLKLGDTVEAEIEGLGILVNKVVGEPEGE